MARFTKPFGRSGAITPAAIDFGKKLLGQLDEQRRLSPGTPTRQVQRAMPDGTIVVASFAGEIAHVHVIAPSRSQSSRLRIALVQGLAVQPRSFADADAYGSYPEAVLMPRDEWRNFLYDASYLDGIGATATGFYGRMQNGQDLFIDGLPSPVKSGWVDWRNADESVVLCWRSSLTRYFPNGSNLAFGQEGILYYNGRALLNIHNELPGASLNRFISGAAINGNTLLLAIVDQPGFSGSNYFRFYKATLQPDLVAHPWFKQAQAVPGVTLTMCPHLQVVVEADVTEVLSIEMPNQNGYPAARFFFNQSANECRAIVHDFDFDSGPGNDALYVYEFVVDWRAHLADAGEDVTYVDTLLSHIRRREILEVVYDAVRINAINGVYLDTMDEFMFETPFDAGGGDHHVLPLAGTVTSYDAYEEGGSAIDWFKLAVDFQDDVPVYLWVQPELDMRETTYTGTASAQASYASSPFTLPFILNAAATAGDTTTADGSRGFGLRAVDKNDDIWFEVTCARSYESEYSGTSSVDADQSSGSAPPVVGSAAVDHTTTYEQVDEWLAMHFMDLRTRSVSYTKVTRTITDEVIYSAVGIPQNGGFEHDYDQSGEQATEYVTDTRVLFFGAEVDSYAGTYTPAPVSHASSGVGPTVSYLDMDDWGWSVVGRFTPLNDPTYFLAKGGDGVPPFPNWDSLETDYPASSDDEVGAPFGVHGQEFYSSTLSSVSGSWPWTHNDPDFSVYIGAWGTFGADWVYSMADLSGDIRTEKWVSHISGDVDDVDAFTGKHGLDSLGHIWPVSTFIHNFTTQ